MITQVVNTPRNLPRDARSIAEEIIAHAGPLNIGACFKRSAKLLSANRWPIIGTTFLVLGIAAIPIVGSLLAGVCVGGLYQYYLRQARGQPAQLADAFQVYLDALGSLLLVTLVTTLLTGVGLMLIIIPGIYLTVAYLFACPLVADRKLDFWTAMEVSRRVVTTQWSRVFLLLLAYIGVCILGLLALGVGIIFTLPLGFGAFVHAYEDLFNPPGLARAPESGTAGIPATDRREVAATSPVPFTDEQVEARTQLHLYRRAQTRRRGAIAFAVGAAFSALLAASWTIQAATGRLFHLPFHPVAGAGIVLLVGLGFAFYSRRMFARSREASSELALRVGSGIPRYRCVCGTPLQRYFWLHIFLSIFLFPWGLFALLFPLKRCRKCNKLYDPAVMNAKEPEPVVDVLTAR